MGIVTIELKSTGTDWEIDERDGSVRVLFATSRLTNEQIAAGDRLGIDWQCVDCGCSFSDDRASEHGIGRCC